MSQLQAHVLPSPIPQTAETLKILPLSDLHLKAKRTATEKLLANRSYFDRMDYVALLGDMVASYGTEDEYRTLAEFTRALKVPYGAINGNHEFYFEVHEEGAELHGKIWKEADVLGKHSQMERFRNFFGYEKIWRAEQNQFGTFLFLSIDDIEQRKPETLAPGQLEFLAEQLREAADPVYVFCHAPLYLDKRLDMTYYDDERTACVELTGEVRELVEARRAPLFWFSGHIHLRPDHYLFAPYELKPGVWQIHLPDSWGYSRWAREHRIPQRHDGLFSRHLEISRDTLTLVTHDHMEQRDIGTHSIELGR